MKSLLCVLVVFGCGGPPKEETTPDKGGGGPGKPAAAGDVSLDLPPIKIEGLVFEPEALGRPGMPTYAPKRPTTLPQQLKIFGAAKDPVDKQAQAAVLATMLYNNSKTQTGPAATALITQARDVLRVVQAYAKDKVEDVTLRLLGSYEIQLEDWSAAEKAWEALVAKAPKDPNVNEHKAWWIYTLLQQNKNAEAAKIAAAETPTDKQPLLAYAIAWAKWRTGDDAGAWTAIAAAAGGWGNYANKEALERDVFLFAGRSSVARDQVIPALYKLFGAKQVGQQYEVLSKLGQAAYQFAGRWADAAATLEDALKLQTTIPAADKMRLPFFIATFLVPLDQPDATARKAKESIAAMPACTQCKPDEKQAIVQQIYGIARIFHLMYATANDVRFYQPAHDLYAEAIPLIMETKVRDEAKRDLDTLQKTLKNTKVGTGTHEKQAMGVLIQRHNQEVQACLEDQLAANARLAGQVTIDLESDATGAILGSSSEPKAGVADLSAVAGCILAHAKDWKLPKRGMAGKTRIKLVYNLAPKKNPAAATAASSGGSGGTGGSGSASTSGTGTKK